MSLLTPPQREGLVRAVRRRSRGQVRLPAGPIGRTEATALWRDLVRAFGSVSDEGRALAPRELELLRRRAWSRSAGHVALTDGTLSRDAGLALWRLAEQLGALTSRQPRANLSRVAGTAVLGLAATQLAACVGMFGGNIKGNFACGAPGGTCAPSTVIDDQALAVIQNARPMAPAGPYFQPPANGPARTAALIPAGGGRLATAGNGVVHRERRVLKVVFPSYVDGAGNFHEPRVVQTVADAGGWMQFSNGGPNIGEQLAGRSAAEALGGSVRAAPAVLAETKPALGVPTGQPLAAHDLGAVQAPPPPAGPGGPPDPRLVAEARARGAARVAASPVEVIKAEVQARLGQSAKAPAVPAPTGQAPLPVEPRPGANTQGEAAPNSIAPAPGAANAPAAFSGRIEE